MAAGDQLHGQCKPKLKKRKGKPSQPTKHSKPPLRTDKSLPALPAESNNASQVRSMDASLGPQQARDRNQRAQKLNNQDWDRCRCLVGVDDTPTSWAEISINAERRNSIDSASCYAKTARPERQRSCSGYSGGFDMPAYVTPGAYHLRKPGSYSPRGLELHSSSTTMAHLSNTELLLLNRGLAPCIPGISAWAAQKQEEVINDPYLAADYGQDLTYNAVSDIYGDPQDECMLSPMLPMLGQDHNFDLINDYLFPIRHSHLPGLNLIDVTDCINRIPPEVIMASFRQQRLPTSPREIPPGQEYFPIPKPSQHSQYMHLTSGEAKRNLDLYNAKWTSKPLHAIPWPSSSPSFSKTHFFTVEKVDRDVEDDAAKVMVLRFFCDAYSILITQSEDDLSELTLSSMPSETKTVTRENFEALRKQLRLETTRWHEDKIKASFGDETAKDECVKMVWSVIMALKELVEKELERLNS